MRRVLLFLLLLPSSAICQTDNYLSAVDLVHNYFVIPNITYHTADNYQSKLDVYRPGAATQPTPVIVMIHGGGWIEGTKESRTLWLLPYLQMGWAAVNVEYRLGRVSRAPAAVEDCRCALHWVFANAAKYNFDPKRVVVTGESSGGHLALVTGMLTSAAGFDRECRTPDDKIWDAPGGTGNDPRVAAIVNWFGITDVLDELHGPNSKGYATVWIGNQPNADALAKQVSPLTYVTKDVPPIITIHGDHDALVPYSQAVRLKEALDSTGVANQLFTIKGGGHGGFGAEDTRQAYVAIREFLNKYASGSVQGAAK